LIPGPVEGIVNVAEKILFADLQQNVGPNERKHRLRVNVRQNQ
jgi:hypothetical protein